MSPRAYDPGAVLAAYEALRREATTATLVGPRGHGLALFLARGLPGWLAAFTALGPSSPPLRAPLEQPRDGAPRLLPAARAALTTVLAGMVLACTAETEGDDDQRSQGDVGASAAARVPVRAAILASAGAGPPGEHGAPV